MASNPTLLCIHRDPAQLRSLQENGYKLLTATTGYEGLRLFATQPVDAIVLDYHLGLLDGPIVANEIKRVRPTIPIVMVADNLELPDGAFSSVDAVVTKSDGAHFLWAMVHFVLSVKPAIGKLRTLAPVYPIGSGGSVPPDRHFQTRATLGPKDARFTAEEWRRILTGTVQF